MIDEHIAWHSRPGNPSAGGRRIDPFPPFGRRPALGSGEEFLLWHEGFVQRFLQWVNGLPANQQTACEYPIALACDTANAKDEHAGLECPPR